MNHSPKILLAMPDLLDPNFSKAVILLLEHDEDGAMGLVLNKPTELTLGAFARSRNTACHKNLYSTPVFSGGPVEKELGWILHSCHSIEEKEEILPNLYISSSMPTLNLLLEEGFPFVKMYLGYAGWGAKQLEAEMAAGSWLTVHPKPAYFEVPADQLWDTILEDLGIQSSQLISTSGVH